LLPQLFDLRVRSAPFGDGRAPVAEQSSGLRGTAVFTRNRQRRADVGRQGISSRFGRGCYREPEASEIVILIVIAVLAAVILHQMNLEISPLRKRNRLFSNENRLARLVPAAGADVDAPCCFVFAVNGEIDRSGDALLAALVIVDRLQRPLEG